MARSLAVLDETWVAYEKIYILELMLIEADSRRFIKEAITMDKDLRQIEQDENARGCIAADSAQYSLKRAKLASILAKINS